MEKPASGSSLSLIPSELTETSQKACQFSLEHTTYIHHTYTLISNSRAHFQRTCTLISEDEMAQCRLAICLQNMVLLSFTWICLCLQHSVLHISLNWKICFISIAILVHLPFRTKLPILNVFSIVYLLTLVPATHSRNLDVFTHYCRLYLMTS